MKAIAVDDYGAAPTLHELPIPEPAEGELLVRVRASSINGFDVAVANGHLKGMMDHRFPAVLGKDFAGTVEATGAGVGTFQPGDMVFGVVTKSLVSEGSWAEYVATATAFAARVPESLDLGTAGALGLACAGALDAIDAIDLSAGHTLLISGATGGAGAIAIQLAEARGAHIIATARPGDQERFVRDLGTHDTVDYGGDLAAAVRALRPEGIDAVLHFAGDGVALSDLLVPGGRIASLVGLTQEQVGGRDVRVTTVVAMPTTSTLERLTTEVAGGLTVPIQRSYPLAQVPQAVTDFAAGKLGKLAVAVE
jgi:NADPH:quinone reductase-like Zn-dependent oxidoreductase